MNFYKYHGAGNDFVLFDARQTGNIFTEEQVRNLCRRRTGIGADGFMTLENDPQAEFYMRYFNADGREGTMCGNGGRCITLFAHHLGIGEAVKTFNSSNGLHTGEIIESDENRGTVRLKMVDVEGYEMGDNSMFIDTGSPHYIEFVNDLDAVDVTERGRAIRWSEAFAPIGGTNVNFVQVMPDGSIGVRTYERGVEDETLACGTGATACALASHILCDPNKTAVQVNVLGGTLEAAFRPEGNGKYRDIYLTGPAVRVFACEADLENM